MVKLVIVIHIAMGTDNEKWSAVRQRCVHSRVPDQSCKDMTKHYLRYASVHTEVSEKVCSCTHLRPLNPSLIAPVYKSDYFTVSVSETRERHSAMNVALTRFLSLPPPHLVVCRFTALQTRTAQHRAHVCKPAILTTVPCQ